MNERSFGRYLRKAITKLGGAAQAIEDSLSVGVPDNLCTYGGVTFVIETKYSKPRLIRSRSIGLSKIQAAWLSRWKRASGVSVVVVRIDNEVLAYDDYFMELTSSQSADWLRGNAMLRFSSNDFTNGIKSLLDLIVAKAHAKEGMYNGQC